MSAFKLSDVLAWLKENPGKRPKHYHDVHDVAEAYEHRVSRMLYQCRQKADAGQLDADTDAAITEAWPAWRSVFPSETPQGQWWADVVKKGGMHEGDLQGRGKGVGGEKKRVGGKRLREAMVETGGYKPHAYSGARENGSLYRLGGRQEMDAFMPAPLACQTEVDQAGMRGLAEELKVRKRVLTQSGLRVPMSERMGIERDGCVEGAIFVLSPTNLDWIEYLNKPTLQTTGTRGRKGPPAHVGSDHLRDVTMRAEFKGYGRWRAHLQQGVFMIICLRCPIDDALITCQEKQQAVKGVLEHHMFSRQVRSALLARRRQPLLYQEFPIVAGADLIDLEGALSGLIRELRSILGNLEEEEHLVEKGRLPSSARVMVEDGWEPVKVITADSTTDEEPFAVRKAGKGAWGPIALAVSEEGACSRVTVNFDKMRAAKRGGTFDGVQFTGSMDQALKDAVLVGLSFMRAHAPWLKEHYGLKIDPRKRRKHDWVFVLNSFGVPITGASIGAAIAAHLATYFTRCQIPHHVFITGEASISGMFQPVLGYQDKLKGVYLPLCPEDKSHFIVPAGSVVDGDCLVEGNITEITATTEGRKVWVPTYHQARVQKSKASRTRVLAAKDLFELLSLSLLKNGQTEANLIPRPAYKIPGLVVTKALVNSIHVDHLGYIQPVEIFVYPGSGETIITSSREFYKHVVEAGILCVRNQWERFLGLYKNLAPRWSPTDTKYDMHIHVPITAWAPVDGNVSLAAAAGYLSHLFGHDIPETVAFFSQTQLMGALNGDNMTLAGWQKARDEGIKTIVLRKSQELRVKHILSRLSEAEKSSIKMYYIKKLDELVPFVLSCPKLQENPPVPVTAADALSDNEY